MAQTNAQSPGAGEDARRSLPAVATLLAMPEIAGWLKNHPRLDVLEALRASLDWHRARLAAGADPPTAEDVLAHAARELVARELQRLRPVVNATGIVLHTGLGRAVLPREAARGLAAMDRCCNLQIDLETGLRGARHAMCERLLCRLTGAEAALIVNNNAAATLLVLAALCGGREVVVSRGQLIEIGGSFRLPDCIHQSGATLVEVGTTNKTHLRDYEAAIGERTAALLRVHPSNYRIIGFSKDVPVAELATLKRGRELLIIDDLGGGALVDLAQWGLPHEPTVQESLVAGADVALFSGDKMIGGPQSGIVVGRRDLIQKIKKHPLTRMLRVGKLTDIALEQTLRLFLEPEKLLDRHPTLRMMAMQPEAIKRRATRLAARLAKIEGLVVRVVAGESQTGGGSLPGTPLPTWLVALRATNFSPERLNKGLRQSEPPVIARIENDEVVLDPRTIFDDEEPLIVQALKTMTSDGART